MLRGEKEVRLRFPWENNDVNIFLTLATERSQIMRLIKIELLFLTAVMFSFLLGCGSTHKFHEEGKQFTLKSDQKIVINQTTKKQIFDMYGQPVSLNNQGKYQILKYHHEQESFKSKGTNPLSFVPIIGAAVTIVELSSDQDNTNDIIREWETMVFYVDLVSGVVKDFYYHDSNLKGHDDSESLYLVSLRLIRNGKNEKATEILEKAISLNPNNHRALNTFAWQLIDLGMDIDKGVKFAEMAVKVFPDSPYNNGTLGVGYFKQGNLDKAEKSLQTAINLYPIYAPQDYKALQHDKAFLERIKQQKTE
jgi:tetratricopeptide (TPR) repeat protein